MTPQAMTKFKDRQMDDHVPVAKMFLPTEYGRGIDHSHIKRMVSKFNEKALGRLVVSLRDDGRFAIIDGNHRKEAALHVGVKDLPCTVFIDLLAEEEAELFGLYNMTKRLTVLDQMKARIAEREPGAIDMRSVLKRNGLDWAFGKVSGLGHVACAAAIQRVYETHGMTALADVIRILVQGFGADARRAFIAPTISGTAMFWVRYRRCLNEAHLLERLHTTDALRLMIEARTLATAFREGNDVGWGRAMRDLYNKGMRINGLPEWTERVLSDKAKAGAPERHLRGVETKKKKRDARA